MSVHVISVCNQKGGVGKTTVILGLADAMNRAGLRVLVVDADPQANATANLGVTAPAFTLNDVLTVDGQTREIQVGVIADAVVPAGEGWAGVGVVASELALAAREQDQDIGREYRLRVAMDGALDAWDVVLIDCPPSLGQLTVNALTAATSVVFVTEPRAASVEGLASMTRTVRVVRQHFNPGLHWAGIVVNRHRSNRLDGVEWVQQLRTDYGDHLLEPFLPEREVMATAASAAAPVSAFGTRAREVTDALSNLADTVLAGSPARPSSAPRA